MSDNYKKMKSWLIENYGSPSRIVGDIVGDLLKRANHLMIIESRSLYFSQQLQELYRDWKDYPEYVLLTEVNWRPAYYPGVL